MYLLQTHTFNSFCFLYPFVFVNMKPCDGRCTLHEGLTKCSNSEIKNNVSLKTISRRRRKDNKYIHYNSRYPRIYPSETPYLMMNGRGRAKISLHGKINLWNDKQL